MKFMQKAMPTAMRTAMRTAIRTAMRTASALLAAAVLMSTVVGCSLEVANPNQASDAQVLNTREGLSALTVGMQRVYATTFMELMLMAPATTTREVAIDLNQVPFVELETGGTALPGLNQHVTDLWTRGFRVINMCDQILANASNTAITMQPGTRSGMLATASTFKAMTILHLAMSFEQLPTSAGTPAAPARFVSRGEAITAAQSLFSSAAQLITATPLSSEFTTQVLARGLNLSNTIALMRARAALMGGQWQEALDLAAAVNTTAAGRSDFSYDNGLNPNPIFNIAFTLIRWQPRQNFGTTLTDTTDRRLAFFMTPRARTSDVNRLPVGTYTPTSFFGAIDRAIPAFRPGEIALIRAEANLRLNRLDDAVRWIDSVRTKLPTQDYTGLGAGLRPYSGERTQAALLEEIFRQRAAELFLTGMRLEDMRRLGRPMPAMIVLTAERNRNFYPYPQSERDNNPNTPATDPPI
jgi:starch-binding outer membrane protein, SusD/RagB family